jgi:hypothetical protein
MWTLLTILFFYSPYVMGYGIQTFTKGEFTSSSTPQLSCVGGLAKEHSSKVESIQCENMATNYWECSSVLPKDLKLGVTNIVCEGISNPDDSLVLKGNCGIEYTLDYTNPFKYCHQPNFSNYGSDPVFHEPIDTINWTQITKAITFLVVLVVLLHYFLDSCFPVKKEKYM